MDFGRFQLVLLSAILFRTGNTDHITDVNKNNIPLEYDQVDISCPIYSLGTHEDDAEKCNIHNVSKEEYDTCQITNPTPPIIAFCDKPRKLMYFTIPFRSFTPQPGGLEFRSGQDYYFILTSSKEDLHHRNGGRCSPHNMKVFFKVCCKADEMNKVAALVPRPALTSSLASPVATSTTPVSPTALLKTLSWREAKMQSHSVQMTTENSDDHDRLSNEVVKNNTSSKSNGGLSARSSNSLFSAGILLPASVFLLLVLG